MTILVVARDRGALGSGIDPVVARLGPLLPGVVIVGGALGVVGYFSFRQFKSVPQLRVIEIGVASDVLTVDERPGMAYRLRGATLGTWSMGGMTGGTALHLQSGTYRFVLGGRDYRPAYQTRLDAPHVREVDAWVSASDFSEILQIAGLGDREDVPAPGSPTRCLLYSNLFLFQKDGFMAQHRIQEYYEASGPPLLAIDIGAEAMWVTDLNGNAFIGSSWRDQVTVIPTTYKPPWTSVYEGTPFLNSAWGTHNSNYSVAPQMIVSAPSMPPLNIVCVEANSSSRQIGFKALGAMAGFGSVRRFEWRGAEQVVREPAEYSVSAADWLTLVGAFGLSEYLIDHV